MNYYFRDIKDQIIMVLNAIFRGDSYLMKGGQALAIHFGKIQASKEARFSKDIDFSFASPSFPRKTDQFCNDFGRIYNARSKGPLYVREIKNEKLPPIDGAYFGIRAVIYFGRKKGSGQFHHAEYFKDIGSPAVIIDFTCNEYVKELVLVDFDGVRIATIPLIVAEKFRALCSHVHDPKVNPLPRAKDFYDLFAIHALVFKRNPGKESLREIKDLLRECFAIKDMPLELLIHLGDASEKNFHSGNYQQQVRETLEKDSLFYDTTFDQAYSEALEFLDKIQAR